MSGTLDYKNYSKRTLSRKCAQNGNSSSYSYDREPAPFHPSLLMRFSGHRQRVLCVDLQQSVLNSSYPIEASKSMISINAKRRHFSTIDEERDRQEEKELLSAPKVLSSGADGACMLWDVRPNMRALRFTTHSAYIHGCAFAPWRVSAINNSRMNGSSFENKCTSYLACCGHDGYVRLWIPTGRSTQSRLTYPIRAGIVLDDYANDAIEKDTYNNPDANRTDNCHALDDLCAGSNYTNLENSNYCDDINYSKNTSNQPKWNISCQVHSQKYDQLYCGINNNNFHLRSKKVNKNYSPNAFRTIWPNREPEVSVCMWKAHAGATRAIAFAHDGSSHLYTAGDDKSVKCWDVEYSTGSSTSTIPSSSYSFWPMSDEKEAGVSWPNEPRVTANSISPSLYSNETLQPSVVKHGKADYQAAHVRHTLNTRHSCRLLGARFVGGFSANVSYVPYQSLLNVQMNSNHELSKCSVTAHTNWVRCLAVQSPFTSHAYFHYLASGGDDRVIHVWDNRSRALAHVFYEADCAIRSLAFAPNGYHLASGDVHGHINIFDLRYTTSTVSSRHNHHIDNYAKYGLVQRYEQAHFGAVHSISFAPNGGWLLSAGEDAEGKLWDVHEGYLYCTVQAHKGPVRSCKFSDDGNFFVTGGDDGAVLLWNSGIPHMTRTPITSAVHIARESTNELYDANRNKSVDNTATITTNNNNSKTAKEARVEKIINKNDARLQHGKYAPKQAKRDANRPHVVDKLQPQKKCETTETQSPEMSEKNANDELNMNANEECEENNNNNSTINCRSSDEIYDTKGMEHTNTTKNVLGEDNSIINKHNRQSESEKRSFTRSEERYSHLGHEIPFDEKQYGINKSKKTVLTQSEEEIADNENNTSRRDDPNLHSNVSTKNSVNASNEKKKLESTSSENSNSHERKHESIVKESKVASQIETSAHDKDGSETYDINNSNNDNDNRGSNSYGSTSENSKTSFIQSAHKLQQLHNTLSTIKQLINSQHDVDDDDEIDENVDAQSIEELKQLMNDVMEQQRLYVLQLNKRRR